MGKPTLLKIGQKFNNLTVISEPFKIYGKAIGYKCKCGCGNISDYIGSQLVSNISKYCRSCANKNRIQKEINKGDVFDKLTVISQEVEIIKVSNGKRNIKNKRLHVCQCICGNIAKYDASHLNTGRSKNCSRCSYKTRPQSEVKYTPLERLFNLSIVQRVKKKNIPLEITIDEYSNIIEANCYYCGAEPLLKRYAGGIIWANGVDRIDSSIGYTLDNCVACCKKCNTMKMDMKVYDFFEQILKIVKHHNLNDKTRVF